MSQNSQIQEGQTKKRKLLPNVHTTQQLVSLYTTSCDIIVKVLGCTLSIVLNSEAPCLDLLDCSQHNFCGDGTAVASAVAKRRNNNNDDHRREFNAGLCACTCGLCLPAASCGRAVNPVPRVRIVGGVDADAAEHPWMAGVRFRGNSTILCGGALVSDAFVLTAAHCVDT